MSIPGFIRSYEASAAVGSFLIVRFSDAANSSKVGPASAASQALVGTTGKVGASAAGVMVDVVRSGLGGVTLGGSVQAGDWLTSNADGKAIATTTAGDNVIGRAEQPGVAGDIIDYFAAPGRY
jgi:surface antigen